MMAGILQQVGKQMKGKISIVKIDTEKYPQLASQNQIQALPTLVVFKNGKPIKRIEGAMQAPQLIAELQNVI